MLQKKTTKRKTSDSQITIPYALFLLVLYRLAYVFGVILLLLPQFVVHMPFATLKALTTRESSATGPLISLQQQLTYSWSANLIHLLVIVLIIWLLSYHHVNFFSKKPITLYEIGSIALYTLSLLIILSSLWFALTFFSPNFSPFTPFSMENIHLIASKSSLYLSTFVAIVLLAPLAEEIIFRGIFSIIFRRYQLIGLIACGIAFSLYHCATDGLAFIWYLVMGLGLGAIYIKTERIEAAIFAHMMLNLCQFVLIIR
ncbi:type II CAAX endopeptidase family protein [uncultured Vagococcus sp.]|uniref:CPBP family intramembrane glutamic endopeptidase n=1 Tax=uncultured Vagococcus sp. TaxID=189676 RepID=UPI0028D1A9EA|nr:type II CAAX endopeptidase family protein [uncultured Vagococcus sp.]